MGALSGQSLDGADFGIVEALAEDARVEVRDLAAQLAMPNRRVRERMRGLERSGVIRGYHAVIDLADKASTRVLVMLRFRTGARPSVDELCTLGGVRQVHALCTGWDFMVECAETTPAMLDADFPRRGVARVLGADAEFEVLQVRCSRIRPSMARSGQQYVLPPA